MSKSEINADLTGSLQKTPVRDTKRDEGAHPSTPPTPSTIQKRPNMREEQ